MEKIEKFPIGTGRRFTAKAFGLDVHLNSDVPTGALRMTGSTFAELKEKFPHEVFEITDKQ
jgi:hypothetical protein